MFRITSTRVSDSTSIDHDYGRLLDLCDRFHFLGNDFLRQLRVGQSLRSIVTVGQRPLQEILYNVALTASENLEGISSQVKLEIG